MFGRHAEDTKHQFEVLAIREDSDADMRDEVDPDPLVEEMVGRLRSGLGSLVAYDEWGRPVAWRQVVRIAAGPTLAALRDAQTAVALGHAVTAGPDDEPAVESSTQPPAPAEQLVPRPSWSYERTATGWAAAPTTFGLRQIELDVRDRPGFATPADRSEV